MNVTYFDTLNLLKILSISDLLFLAFSCILLLISGSYLTIRKGINFAFSKVYTVAIIYSYILFLILTTNLRNIGYQRYDDSFLISVFNQDFLTSKFLNILYIFIIIFFIIVYAYISNRSLRTTFEYPVILLVIFFSMVLLLKTEDLFIWFLAIELQSFCFYTLAAYRTNRSYLQTEAGLKYFLFGSIASALYLFGTSLIYVGLGTLNFSSVAALVSFPLENIFLYEFSLFIIFISIFFKLGVAPFHFWLPFVYTNSIGIVNYLFILLPKIPLIFLLTKFCSLNNTLSMDYIRLPLLLSLIIGTLFAFRSSNIKTFFAYSAIANSSFFLAPLLSKSIMSTYSLLLYIFVYNILITIAFIPILSLKRFDGTTAFTNLRDLLILKKSAPLLAWFYVFMALSLLGCPPFLGFFAKLGVLLSALSVSSYFIVGCLLFFSLVSSYYYLRLIKIIFFSFNLRYQALRDIKLVPAILLSICTIIHIAFIVQPNYIFLFFHIIS